MTDSLVVSAYTLFAVSNVLLFFGCNICGMFGCSGSIHSPVVGSLCPFHTLSLMLYVAGVGVICDNTSGIAECLMEISDALLSPGTMWACLAWGGRHGIFNIAVWVDFNVVLLGRFIFNGAMVGLTSWVGASGRII
jgi:hypothetical protein